MKLPRPRGPVSEAVVAALAGTRPLQVSPLLDEVAALDGQADPLADDDLHLALWVMYELHYRGFDGVDDRWEWQPDLMRVRGALEERFEAALEEAAAPHVEAVLAGSGDLPGRLFALCEEFEGPSVARFVHREATREQMLEFLVHRSIYHLKESDPHSWVIPRVHGRPKAALVELQYDEYGGGRPDRIHAEMFGDALEACGLDRDYGAYVDLVPGYTLALNNAMSLLGLHRRLAPAAMGHLGAFEATSSLPCRKFAGGVRRLGLAEPLAAYFDEHIEADAVHEQLALREICGALAEGDPEAERLVAFGSTVCLLMDAVAGERMLAGWSVGASTLRQEPAPAETVAVAS